MFTSGSGSLGWTVYGNVLVSQVPGARLAEKEPERSPRRLSAKESNIRSGLSPEPSSHTRIVYVTVSPALLSSGPDLVTLTCGWNRFTVAKSVAIRLLSNPSGW